jgi:hypothetical protein
MCFVAGHLLLLFGLLSFSSDLRGFLAVYFCIAAGLVWPPRLRFYFSFFPSFLYPSVFFFLAFPILYPGYSSILLPFFDKVVMYIYAFFTSRHVIIDGLWCLYYITLRFCSGGRLCWTTLYPLSRAEFCFMPCYLPIGAN